MFSKRPDDNDRVYLIDGLTLKQVLSVIKEFYQRNPEFEDELKPIARKLIGLEDVTDYAEGTDPMEPDPTVFTDMSKQDIETFIKGLEDELESLRGGLDESPCDLDQLLKQTGLEPPNTKE